MNSHAVVLAGFGPLLRTNLRHEAWTSLPWIAAVTGLAAGSAASYDVVLPDVQSRVDLELTIRSNPAFKLVFGPVGTLATPEGFTAWHALTLGCLFTAVMSALLVIRTSRVPEDSGQAELLTACVVGRGTRLAVAETLGALASLATGVLTLAGCLLAGTALAAAATLAAAFVAAGLVFGAMAALAAQVCASAPTARTLSLATLGVLFMVRGWVDTGDRTTWTTWLTPFGWIQKTVPAVRNDLTPLLAVLALTFAVAGAAHLFNARRDFGMGLLAPRQGAARGGWTATLTGSTWRFNQAATLAWGVALLLVGAEFGNIATSIGPLIRDNPDLSQIIAAGATSERQIAAAFVLVVVNLLGILAALPGIQVMNRVAADESNHLLEPILATAVTRGAYFARPAALALLSSAAAMMIGGVGLTLVAIRTDVPLSAADLLRQSAACLPATLCLVTLAIAAVGLARPLAGLGWVGAGLAFGLTILGPLFHLNETILSASPFWHVPDITRADIAWTGTLVVGAVALGLLMIGPLAFSRRDVH